MEDNLRELAELKDKLAELKDKLAELDNVKRRYDEVKQLVLFEMMANKSKRTETVNGVYAVRSERTDVRVTDPILVESWLEDNNFNLSEYKRLDLQMVTPLIKGTMIENGEFVPGAEVVSQDVISIRGAK